MNELSLFSIIIKGIGFAILFGATYLMLRESTYEFQYLKRVWNENIHRKYKIFFLLFVILMYLLSLFPMAIGVLFVFYGGFIYDNFW